MMGKEMFRIESKHKVKLPSKRNTYVLQVTAVVLLVDELFDVLQRPAGAAVQRHAGDGLGGLVLVALVLVHQGDALAGGVLLHGQGALLDGALETGLVQALRVQRIGAEEVAHAAALQQVRGAVPRQQPVQVGGGVHHLRHFLSGEFRGRSERIGQNTEKTAKQAPAEKTAAAAEAEKAR